MEISIEKCLPADLVRAAAVDRAPDEVEAQDQPVGMPRDRVVIQRDPLAHEVVA